MKTSFKILAALVLLCLSLSAQAREVKRIIKKVYLHRSYYYGAKFKKLITKQFKRFDKSYVMLFKEVDHCIHEHHKDPPACEEICLGKNFKRVKQRYEMVTLRVRSIFDNILQVLFNDNCMNNKDLIETCKTLWDDILVLDYYGYNINLIVQKNKDKYIDELFTKQEFDRIFELVKFLFDKFKKYMKERENVRMVMLGRLYNIVMTKTRQYKTEDHESIIENPDGIDQEKFGMMFQKKLEEEFKNPTKAIEDPESSIQDQVGEIGLWDEFKWMFQSKNEKQKMTQEEAEEIERKFENDVEKQKQQLQNGRADFEENDNTKQLIHERQREKLHEKEAEQQKQAEAENRNNDDDSSELTERI